MNKNGEQVFAGAAASPRIASVRTDQVSCLDHMEANTMYPVGCFAGWVLPRGRKLNEALANDPEAPRPIQSRFAKNSKLYTRAQIEEYISHLDQPADLAMQISRHVTELNTQAELHKARISESLREEIGSDLRALQGKVSLFMEDLLRRLAAPVPKEKWGRVCGVYFLRREGEIIYVGQSVNVLSRVDEHTKRLDFDEVEVLRCHPDELNDYEGFFIRFLRPHHNGWEPNKGAGAPRSRLWERFEKLGLSQPHYPAFRAGPTTERFERRSGQIVKRQRRPS